MRERGDRDLIGQRNAMYAGETQKNREEVYKVCAHVFLCI